ncbi:hypothetical protein DPX16_11221 [Anabarilius grahami]|uniref:Uncharacterized protein n=1 Tax=Anabarilius grahami TaxID=495550 RepID=A0A3N0Y3G0_ANAGA|nr:hypothetical protein DPX16_11221 [Anabarilius grahami]
MDRVDSLAEYLVELRNQPSLALTNQQVSDIVALWQNLLDCDKQMFAARYQSKLDTGRFRSPKKRQEFTPGSGLAHQYHLPSSTIGQAQVKRKRNIPSAPVVLSPPAEKPQTQRQLFPAPLVMLTPMASQGLSWLLLHRISGSDFPLLLHQFEN